MNGDEAIRWRLIDDDARDGATQMALEEAAARTARESALATVRVYDWSPSTVTMGYNQAPATIDWSYCRKTGIDVTRRQTGGGGIYHDAVGDIAYTIVTPTAAVPGDLMECYEHFCEPILDALRDSGVHATFANTQQPSLYEPSCYLRDVHPAHDIVVEGAKVSGNAQYRQRDAVIQHGSITYQRSSEHTLGVFDTDEIDRSTVEDRVTGITDHAAVSRESVRSSLATSLQAWCDAREGEWRPEELEHATELVETKYGATSWIRDRTTPPTIDST